MTVLERHVHHLSNMAAFWERERKFKEAEDRLGGFPAKRYYSLFSGRDALGTIVHERDWENFAAIEAAYERLFNEPGINELGASGPEIGNTEHSEFYFTEQPQ